MKDYHFVTLFFVSLFSLSAQKEILSADNDICRLFPENAVLRKPGTCTNYITCVDHKSVDDKQCEGTTLFWELKSGKCVKTVSDDYCKTSCVKASDGYIVDKKNCNRWYYCDGTKQINEGDCEKGLYFDQASQLCVYPSGTTCEATYEICDVAASGVPFYDADNCHKYFSCTDKGALQVNTCATGTYYDLDSGACIAKAQVDCYKHPIPDGVCGTVKLAIRNRFVNDGATCSGYFYCRDGGMNTPDKDPQWGECSGNLFFSEEDQACIPSQVVKCNEDRCAGLDNVTTLSEKAGCQHYLTCENGYTVDETQCPLGTYYDIVKNDCTNEIKSYTACSA